MKKAIFYLSKGSLKSIIERDSLWVASTNNLIGDFENVTITIDGPRPLVQVVKLEKFQYYPNTSIPRYVLELFDGEMNLPVSIQLSNDDKIKTDEENFTTINDIENKVVRSGSVLMIHRYRLIHSSEYFTKDELLVENIPNKILCITDFTLIGYSENINKLSQDILDESNNKKQQYKKNKFEVEATHNISDLNPRLSKLDWSIKCRLMEKTLVREFENRQNGVKGRVMRLLLLDKTSQIELVAFNDHCDNQNLKNMKLKKYYIIKNGEIKLAKNNLKSWPDQVSLQFEIHISNQTEIIEAQRDESDSEDENIMVSEDKESETNDDIEKDNKNQYKQVLHQKFTLFDELVKKKCESLVDVIGIITEIGELKKIKKNELSIRNFKMVDKTKTIITFALWGKQAESFDSKKGSVLIISKAKITNYGGLSLSVIRISEIIKINPNANNKIANDLYEWWREKWWKSRNNNQQIIQKRSIESDEDNEQIKEDKSKKRKT